MMSSQSCKRQRLEPRLETNVDLDVLSKCLPYLQLTDVNSVSLACTEWRDYIWSSALLWEGLLAQKYPSHKALPVGWCTSGREEYIRRLIMMKSQYAIARSLPGIPIPLQGKTPCRWNPDTIIILIDVFTGRHHFDDDAIDMEDENHNNTKKRLGAPVPIFSRAIKASSTDGDDVDVLLSDDEFSFNIESELSAATQDAALETIEHVCDQFDEFNGIMADMSGLYVEMSYFVEGGAVPRCEPITLLSEHHTFFVEDRVSYRTDVESCWLPSQQQVDNSESIFDKTKALTRSRMMSRQLHKYGGAPLPFDPEVEIWISPPGRRSRHEDEEILERIPRDSDNKCSICVEFWFSRGEDHGINFANRVVPPLLSLWNDTARQEKRKSLAQFSR